MIANEIIKHLPANCSNCGNDLVNYPEVLISARQLLNIPPMVLKCIAHRFVLKKCSCGRRVQGNYPQHVACPVQYGKNVETPASYLHAIQNLPYNIMQEFLKDVMRLPLITGGTYNILQRMARKAKPLYDQIKVAIAQADCVGADETSVNINGKNHWAWTWQNHKLTCILCAAERGFKTQMINYYNAFKNDCNKTQIKLCLVCAPYFLDFIGTDSSIMLTKQIAKDKNIDFLDFSRVELFLKNEKLFDER